MRVVAAGLLVVLSLAPSISALLTSSDNAAVPYDEDLRGESDPKEILLAKSTPLRNTSVRIPNLSAKRVDDCSEKNLQEKRKAGYAFYQKFFAKYEKGEPRKYKGPITHDDISVDFEMEKPQLVGGPNLFLKRGGITMPGFTMADFQPKREEARKFWSAGVDGGGPLLDTVSGGGIGFQQQMFTRLEFSSEPIRPQMVFETPILSYMNEFLVQQNLSTVGRPQYTVGLAVERIPQLLALSDDGIVKQIVSRTNKLCSEFHHGSCSPGYEGLVMMASHTLHSTIACVKRAEGECLHPKRCQRPWLYRTHFGDITNYVMKNAETTGFDVRRYLVSDILAITGIPNPDDPLLGKEPKVMEYMHFEEMAEISGFVQGRTRETCLWARKGAPKTIPMDFQSLKEISQAMVDSSDSVDRRLRNRRCTIYGAGDYEEELRFTSRQWVEEMLNGKDLMSDHHSAAAQAAFSHTVWNSMGKWRLRDEDEGRVYLECRAHSHRLCMRGSPPFTSSYKHKLEFVAEILMVLESTPPLEPVDAAALKKVTDKVAPMWEDGRPY